MQNLVIDANTPLTRDIHGIQVFVVLDSSGSSGVYFSLERAIAYIMNWLQQGDLPMVYTEPIEITPGYWSFCGYRIEGTYLRI